MTKVRRQSVYIAGKYRSKYGFIGRLWHVWKAGQAGMRLKAQGYVCFNPIVNWGLFGLFDKDDTFWLAAGLKLLPDHEIIYMMEGWEESEGAVMEWHEAIKRKLQIQYENKILASIPDSICSEPLPFTDIEPGKTVNCQIKADSSFTSKCCHAGVNIDGDDVEGTHYWTCAKCGKPCDLESQLKEIAENGK